MIHCKMMRTSQAKASARHPTCPPPGYVVVLLCDAIHLSRAIHVSFDFCTASISQTKAELLHQQSAQVKELRRKHEEAQRAVATTATADGGDDDDDEEEEEEKPDGRADEGGLASTLRKVRRESRMRHRQSQACYRVCFVRPLKNEITAGDICLLDISASCA